MSRIPSLLFIVFCIVMFPSIGIAASCSTAGCSATCDPGYRCSCGGFGKQSCICTCTKKEGVSKISIRFEGSGSSLANERAMTHVLNSTLPVDVIRRLKESKKNIRLKGEGMSPEEFSRTVQDELG